MFLTVVFVALIKALNRGGEMEKLLHLISVGVVGFNLDIKIAT